MRRRFLARGLAFVACGLLGLSLHSPPRGMDRPAVRNSTAGSVKWEHGHNAGCVLYAPDDECICDEFKK